MKASAIVVSLACLAAGLTASIAFVQLPHAGAKLAEAAAPALEKSNVAPVTATAPSAIQGTQGKETPFTWKKVESDDYHQYIANLRAVGCPEQTIRDIIVADVNKLYAARENPLKTAPKPTADGRPGETPEQKLDRLRQLRALQQEKRWVVKELLGIDIPLDMLPSSGSRDYHAFEVALLSLPPEKRDSVQVLQETYWQQVDALKAKYGKKQGPEYQAESRQLTASLRQELTKTLTPQELEEYDMRTSNTAKQLSTSLASYFKPSEEEFRKIFRAKHDYEETIQQLATPTAPLPQSADPAERAAAAQRRAADQQALAQARTTAMSQLNDQLKTTLGDDRYKQYQQSQDRTYDLLARLGQRYGLGQDAVQQAYDLQSSLKGQLPSPDAGPAAAQANTAAMQKQLEEQLTAILGEQALRGYKRVNGGNIPIK